LYCNLKCPSFFAHQLLLYKLGYVERADLGVVPSSGPMETVQKQALLASAKQSFFSSMFSPARVEAPAKRSTLQVCVLGDNGVGKSSFVWYLTGLRAPGIGGDFEIGVDYAKFNDCIVVGGCALKLNGEKETSGTQVARKYSIAESASDKAHKKLLEEVLTPSYQLSVAAVPLDQVERWLQHCIQGCDLVVLMFQCGKPSSLKTCMALEARLPETVPRLYLASKTDLIFTSQALHAASAGSSGSLKGEYGNETRSSRESLKAAHESVLQTASLHIRERNLPALSMFSTLTGEGMTDATSLIVEVATDPTRGVPQRKSKPSETFVTSRAFVTMAAVVVTLAGASLVARYNKEVKEWWKQMMDHTRSLFSTAGLIAN